MKIFVLHLGNASPILFGFWQFLETRLNPQGHLFLSAQSWNTQDLKEPGRIQEKQGWLFFRDLLFYTYQAKQIVIHGLFDFRLVVFLFFQPWLLKKCYWIIWGADLYRFSVYQKNWKWKVKEFFRRPVIKKMAYLVTGTPGDFKLAQLWYQAKGRHIQCFNYPSNLFKVTFEKQEFDHQTHILVGNSSDPENNHLEIFEKLKPYKDQNIIIYCPLSYGNPGYAQHVIETGKHLFSEKFVPLLEFMPLHDYVKLLNQISIAIFAHNIQQAFGNKITLLGLGKKVYLKKSSTLWEVLTDLNLTIFEFDDLNIEILSPEISSANREIVQREFSEDSLQKSLSSWLLQA